MDKNKIQEGVKLILEGIGENIYREGLLETPDRIARMYEELAAGYTDDASEHLKKRFHVDNNDMVIEKDIHFYSFCQMEKLWDSVRLPVRWRSMQSAFSCRSV